ncbi:MAG: diadenylate cyclase [Candidatus Hadarchaeota archaeon]
MILTENDGYIQPAVNSTPDGNKKPTIVVTSNQDCFEKLSQKPEIKPIRIQAWHEGMGRISQAISVCMREKLVSKNQSLVCLVNDGVSSFPSSLFVVNVTGEEKAVELFESNPILANVVDLSIELSKAGPGQKPIGASFMVGASKDVLRFSYQLYRFNPFETYEVLISDQGQWDLLKKYALSFDGAFIIDENGRAVAACRYLNADRKVEIPKGLGTRHLSVANMTAATNTTGVTVSGEDGMVRIFRRGRIIAKINPNNRIIEYTQDAV